MVRTLIESLVRQGAALLTHDVATQSAFLRARSAREAVVAPLVVEGETLGVLAVYDRLGEVRGFAESDVQLLQTVANHASVALHNEMLIGRLRHDALHDALTGLPNRSHLTALATSAVARATAGALAGRDDDHRPERLQGRQRHPRPPRRRRADPARSPSASAPPPAPASRWRASAATSSPCCSSGPTSSRRTASTIADGDDRRADRADPRRRGPAAPVRRRRHRDRARPRHRRRRPAQAGGHRDVRGQERPGAGRRLPHRHRPQRPVAALAHGRAARGAHQRPHRHRGRAGHRPARRAAGRRGGARPLAPPDPRHAAAGRVPAAGRAQRPDRAADRAGAGPRRRRGARSGATPAGRSASRSTCRRDRCWTARCRGPSRRCCAGTGCPRTC